MAPVVDYQGGKNHHEKPHEKCVGAFAFRMILKKLLPPIRTEVPVEQLFSTRSVPKSAHCRASRLHYHEERNHQGKDNRILLPSQTQARRNMGAVRCRERLGGLLKYYEREAA